MYSSPIVVLAGSSWLSVVPTAARRVPWARAGAVAAAVTPMARVSIRMSRRMCIPFFVLGGGLCRRDQRVRIDRPREIHLGDRFVLKPESCQCRDRIWIAVDAQVDIWKRLAVSDNERRRDQRLEFAACLLACFQRGDQPCREMRLGIGLESS